jgi:mannose-6-phosphate isomerase-like protein (cupin superfamily)
VQVAGFVRRSHDGDAHWFYGNLFTIKVAGEHTHGQFAVIECTSPPGFAPGTHVHAGEDETFFVLAGTLRGHSGEEPWEVGPGDLVFVPRDTPHGFTVTGEVPARYLVVVGPPAFDAEVAASPAAQAMTLPPPPAG